MILSILLSVISLGWTLHPFHVSVTQLEYQAEEKAIQISSKVFLDDLETCFNEEFETDLDLWDERDNPKVDSLIQIFFEKHLKIWVNGKEKELIYIGKETSLDDTWVHFQVKRVRRLKSLKAQNTFGIIQFDDQVNLLHLEYGDDEDSMRLDRDKLNDEFELD